MNLLSQSHNLTLLWYLRWVAIGGQAVTILLVSKVMDIPLPLIAMGSIVAFQGIFNLLVFFRLSQEKHVGNNELLAQLLFDTAILTAQLYCSGGSSNPFTGLFLLQVIIAATILPPRYTWVVVAVTLGCYLFLVPFNIPIPHIHHYHLDGFFSLHLQGMLISYSLSAVLVAFFIVRMAQHLKERDRLIATQQEQAKAQEYILHLGMLAAGAAHELGTPLSTIATLSGEIRAELPATDKPLFGQLDMLDAQVARCKGALQRLAVAANAVRAENTVKMPLDHYFRQVVERWQRSALVPVSYHFSSSHVPVVAADTLLDQAIHNLLDNAANAAASHIHIRAACDAAHISLEIEDNGKGMDEGAMQHMGKPMDPLAIESSGTGLGLFLSHAVVGRLKGTLAFSSLPGAGVRVTLAFPLSSIEVAA